MGAMAYFTTNFAPIVERVVQYSDKFMHGIVLYSLHITILYKSITIKNETKQ